MQQQQKKSQRLATETDFRMPPFKYIFPCLICLKILKFVQIVFLPNTAAASFLSKSARGNNTHIQIGRQGEEIESRARAKR